ncbi:MAG: translation initiation factor IF-3 [Myxococcales bacterium]|nr:translation initiation factor IF-3 [Myxococcales bacterium]
MRVNQRIRVPEVRLIGPDGTMIGIMSSAEALERARQAGLDLVEVNPKAQPPVCRLMDYGKFKYEQKKQANLARKRQTVIEIKEIKFRPKTDDHDYDFKLRHIRRFLADGDKAKITVRFRGRELAHPQVAQQLLDRIVNELKDEAVVEQGSRMEGRTMFLLLAPKAGAKPAAPAPAPPTATRPVGPLPPAPRPTAPPPEHRDERDIDRDDEEEDEDEDE